MKKNILGTAVILLLSSTAVFAGADAGIDQEVRSGEQIQLSGAESTLERAGRFVRFEWRQTEGEPFVRLRNERRIQATFTAPTVTESTVLTFRLTTKERDKNGGNRRSIVRSKDFVDVIILPKEEGIVTESVEPTDPSVPIEENPNQITSNGFSYLPVMSPITGRIWLDRNLGAINVCDTPTDGSCFGDLYQWGRNTDGHQIVTSDSKEGIITLDEISNEFMTGNLEDGTYVSFDDWTFDSREILAANWSSTDGSSVCPVGYRVPTIVEIESEGLNLLDDAGLENNFMKIPLAGYRPAKPGDVILGKQQEFTLWSTSTIFAGKIDIGYGKRVTRNFPVSVDGELIIPDSETSVSVGQVLRQGGDGFSVRCIED